MPGPCLQRSFQRLVSRAARLRSLCTTTSAPAHSEPRSDSDSHWDEHRLSADQLQFRALASVSSKTSKSIKTNTRFQEFARKELLPNSSQWEQDKFFPVHVLRQAAKLGFAGLFCSQDVGGSELTRQDGAVIFEALAYGDVSTTAYLTIHNMCSSLVDRYGTQEQRHKWLPSLTQMEILSSYCLTEPGSGSDAASLQTIARQKANTTDYILNGSKAFISGGGASDLYLVMARTGPAGAKGITCFLVEKGMAGLSFGRPEDKLGWCCQPTTSVILDDVCVPAANLLGKQGQGFSIAMTGLDGGRINIGSCSVGGAQYCFDAAREYATTRKQFGKSIIDFQSSHFKLADMLTAVQASRLMIANAAAAIDAGSPKASACAAMAKRFATDACFNVANDALQLHGGYGYLKDYKVEKYLRDLRVHSILEGTNEIMRVVISRQM